MPTVLKIVLLFFVLCSPAQLRSQVLPKEGSILNYRIIGFSFTPQKENSYKIEIATGNYTNLDSFRQHIIKTQVSSSNRLIIEVPSFGSAYTWRIVYSDPSFAIESNRLHHFSIGNTQNVDSTFFRLRVIKGAEKYKDAFVCVDGTRVIYNMQGQPVWFLPKYNSRDNDNNLVRDLKLSAAGTLTFLTADDAYEVNDKGKILWQGPNDGRVSGNEIEGYHHEFTRLGNGHRMLLGNELLSWKTDSVGKVILNNAVDKGTGVSPARTANFGTIIEYDQKDSVVWSWKSSAYYESMWLLNYNNPANIYKDVHQNAFFFDERHKYVYVSFKNTNQVIKIKYPDGNIVAVYGQPDSTNDLFCCQHGCKASRNGLLYLFNNNTCHQDGLPGILIMRQRKGKLKKTWEYSCPVNVTNEKYKELGEKRSVVGGNVIELPDHTLFASSPDGAVFIVNRGKKLLWNAQCEKRTINTDLWLPLPLYRASIIADPKDLEQLIWNSEAKE